MKLRKAFRFTLLEMMVVLVIITLILALVMPRVGRLPSGLLVRSAAAQIRGAFRQAATCARATGATVTLTLEPDKNQFHQTAATNAPAPVPVAPAVPAAATTSAAKKTAGTASPANGEEPPAPNPYAEARDYTMPKGVEWHLENVRGQADAEAPLAYTFYASGEAAGPTVEYSVGKRRFRIDVDRLTGRPAITDVD